MELSITNAPVDDLLVFGGDSWGSGLRVTFFAGTIIVGETF